MIQEKSHAKQKSGKHKAGSRGDRSKEKRLTKKEEASLKRRADSAEAKIAALQAEHSSDLKSQLASERRRADSAEAKIKDLQAENAKLSDLVEWERTRRIQEEGEAAYWQDRCKRAGLSTEPSSGSGGGWRSCAP